MQKEIINNKTNRMRARYKITVKTLQGTILTFNVDDYKIINGEFVRFLDRITNKEKRFHSSNCEIEVKDE